MDLFVLSVGEAPARSCTKIGGLPFWKRNRPWPTIFGEPLPFLAQFNFQESQDLVGELPGDMLLVFAHADFRSGIRLEWENVSAPLELIEPADVPIAGTVPAFFGNRWRVPGYPFAETDDDVDLGWIDLADGTTVLNAYFLLELIGMQIGEHPSCPVGSAVAGPGDRLICALSSIAPSHDCPYPFLNYPDRLDAEMGRRLTLHLGGHVDADDFRTMYFSISRDGTTNCIVRGL